jgi:hypothetical protein
MAKHNATESLSGAGEAQEMKRVKKTTKDKTLQGFI